MGRALPSEARSGSGRAEQVAAAGVHPRKRAVASALGPGPDKPPTHGLMEYDTVIADRLEPTIGETCQAAGKRPHIMVHDESSFDITAAPGIRIPPDYRRIRMVGGRHGDPLG